MSGVFIFVPAYWVGHLDSFSIVSFESEANTYHTALVLMHCPIVRPFMSWPVRDPPVGAVICLPKN